MAKITALSALTTLEDGDLLAVVEDPAGTPVTKKITVANFRKSFGEDDADGRRIPLVDTTGTIKGYVGYSASAQGVAIWFGDVDGVIDFDVPLVTIDEQGAVYIQAADAAGWMAVNTATSGRPAVRVQTDDNSGGMDVFVGGEMQVRSTLLKMVNVDTAGGVDGTATPSTVAQLADVLVDLGVIASHTIP